LFARARQRRLFGFSGRITQFIRTFTIKPNETEIGMIAGLHPLACWTLTASARNRIGLQSLTEEATCQRTAKFQGAGSKGSSHKQSMGQPRTAG
jgi:hypothetical protein